MTATYQRYILDFKKPSGTSRGVMTQKETYFIILRDEDRIGIGECGLLRGLSYDDRPDYEEKLAWVCANVHRLSPEALADWPSIRFGLEMALLSLRLGSPFELFPSAFTRGEGISINGLVWMGSKDEMRLQVQEKLQQGFSCVKLKIGAIDFLQELELLAHIRKEFDAQTIEIRVDANGAFSPAEALEKLKALAEYSVHSIEQPIRAGQLQEMKKLCELSPIPIALDEELIGVTNTESQRDLLQTIRPQYIILKPSLVGGFRASERWIEAAAEFGIGWWATSALESNIGLNAIAQWAFTQENPMPQGLGTGALYTNNIDSPLKVSDGKLFYGQDNAWDVGVLGLRNLL